MNLIFLFSVGCNGNKFRSSFNNPRCSTISHETAELTVKYIPLKQCYHEPSRKYCDERRCPNFAASDLPVHIVQNGIQYQRFEPTRKVSDNDKGCFNWTFHGHFSFNPCDIKYLPDCMMVSFSNNLHRIQNVEKIKQASQPSVHL